MYLTDLIASSFRNLFRRKVRSILTILGVVIGTIAIVLMISIGYGLEETYKRQLENMGSLTTVNVYIPYNPGIYETRDMVMPGRPGRPGNDGQRVLDDDAVMQMSQIDHVEAVIPLMRTYLKFGAGRYVAYVSLIGIIPEHMPYLGLEAAKGQLLDEHSTFDVVFGHEVLYQFQKPGQNNYYYYDYYYPGQPGERPQPEVDIFGAPLIMTYNMMYGEPNPGGGDQPIQYRNYRVNAMGILAGENYSEYAYTAFMNLEQVKVIMREHEQASNQKLLDNGYSDVRIKVDDIKNVKTVQDDLKMLGYDSYSLSDALDSMNEMTKTIQMVLGGIAGVAFLIAAIGIANTMLMSIYERTKEIGVMKVLGCLVPIIRRMFLFEAALIGLTGGLIGTGVSLILSQVANRLIGSTMFFGHYGGGETIISLITPQLAFGAIIFSTAVGVIFGLYPAIRATKISPLEAIRHE